MKKAFNVIGRVLGLLLILAALHSAAFERDYARACFELLLSFMFYPHGWPRSALGKESARE